MKGRDDNGGTENYGSELCVRGGEIRAARIAGFLGAVVRPVQVARARDRRAGGGAGGQGQGRQGQRRRRAGAFQRLRHRLNSDARRRQER